MSSSVAIMLVTAPEGEQSEQLAETLVRKRFAACVSRIGKVRSIYVWEGKVNHDREELLVIKTASEKTGEVQDFIRKIHPSDVPEIRVLEVNGGDSDYLEWVLENVG